MAESKLIVYKKEGCFKCEQIMNLLDMKNIEYEKRCMKKYFSEVEDYPYFAQNLYPVMKYDGEYITYKEICKRKVK